MSQRPTSQRSAPSLDLLESYSSDEDGNSEYDQNDIVLSPLWSRSRSHSMSLSASNPASIRGTGDRGSPVERHSPGSSELDEHERDFVLIVPGSSILSTPSRSPTVLSTYSASASSSRHRSFDSNLLTSTPNTTIPSWFEDYEKSRGQDSSKMNLPANTSAVIDENEDDDDESDLDLTGALQELRLSSSKLHATNPSQSSSHRGPTISASTTSQGKQAMNPFVVFSEDTPRATTPVSFVDATTPPLENPKQQNPSGKNNKKSNGSRRHKGPPPLIPVRSPAPKLLLPIAPAQPKYPAKPSQVNSATVVHQPARKEPPVHNQGLTNSQKRSAQRRRARARLEAQQKAQRLPPTPNFNQKEKKKTQLAPASLPLQHLSSPPLTRPLRATNNLPAQPSTANSAPKAKRGRRGGRGKTSKMGTTVRIEVAPTKDDEAENDYDFCSDDDEAELYQAAVIHMDG